MKLILLLSLFYICQYSYGQNETERIQNDFQKTKEIVDGNHFKIVFSIATPLSGVNVRIDSAWVAVNGKKASGYLPYYTGNYGFSMTGNKGILFDNEMLNRTEKIKGRKVKKPSNTVSILSVKTISTGSKWIFNTTEPAIFM